jgi:hypothetical protein
MLLYNLMSKKKRRKGQAEQKPSVFLATLHPGVVTTEYARSVATLSGKDGGKRIGAGS